MNHEQAALYFDRYLGQLGIDLSSDLLPSDARRLEPFERAGADWYLARFLHKSSSEVLAASHLIASYEASTAFPNDIGRIDRKLVTRLVRRKDWSRMTQVAQTHLELLRDAWLVASSRLDSTECDRALDLLEQHQGFSGPYFDAASRAGHADRSWVLASRPHRFQHTYQTLVVTAVLETLGGRALFDWGRERSLPLEVWKHAAPHLLVLEPAFEDWFEKTFRLSASERRTLSHRTLVVRACSGDLGARSAALEASGKLRFEAELELFFAYLHAGRFDQALELLKDSGEPSQTQLRYELLFEAMWSAGLESDAVSLLNAAPTQRRSGMTHRLVLALTKDRPISDLILTMERLAAKPDDNTLPICLWRAGLDDDSSTAERLFRVAMNRPKISSTSAQFAALGFCGVRDPWTEPFP